MNDSICPLLPRPGSLSPHALLTRSIVVAVETVPDDVELYANRIESALPMHLYSSDLADRTIDFVSQMILHTTRVTSETTRTTILRPYPPHSATHLRPAPLRRPQRPPPPQHSHGKSSADTDSDPAHAFPQRSFLIHAFCFFSQAMQKGAQFTASFTLHVRAAHGRSFGCRSQRCRSTRPFRRRGERASRPVPTSQRPFTARSRWSLSASALFAATAWTRWSRTPSTTCAATVFRLT